MARPERFDALVLGSGTGGKLIAWHMAQTGRRTAVVERRWIGGACPNIACMPSKNEIMSAEVAHLARHGAQFGTMTGPVAVDMAKVRRRKREMVDDQIAAHLQNYKASGAELIMGSGRFVAPKTLEVSLNDGGTRVLAGDRVFLNVGTHAAVPSVPGLEAARPLTHIEALELDYLPPHLIVIGGGYAGLELAQAYRRFGSAVTIIESGPQLMGREDIDVSLEMRRILTDEGIDVVVEAELLHARGRSGEKVSVGVRTASGEQSIEGSDVLVAVGRVPNTTGIGLEDAGVELDGRGYIRVNERLETSASKIWAIGECAGSPQFTHVSEDDFRIVRDNLAGGKRSTHDRLVPYCMFTDPPLAHVGLSEREAERQGVIARVARLPTSAVLRAQATGDKRGFMKALVGENDDRILGFTMIGAPVKSWPWRKRRCWRTWRIRGSATPFWRTRRWPRAWVFCSRRWPLGQYKRPFRNARSFSRGAPRGFNRSDWACRGRWFPAAASLRRNFA
jgi:pyruvate/2-oxoglutarate dehydrogenase complex dihydrolipoamide dehydrogenase (E3) component